MAQLNEMPNFEEVKEGSFEPLAEGDYIVMVTDSDIKDTKKKIAGDAKRGEYIQVRFQVVEGAKAGQTILNFFNIKNDNETAERIGQAELKKLCIAVGLDGFPENTVMLHDKPLLISVKHDKEGRAVIKNFKPKPTYQATPPEVAEAPKTASAPSTWG